MRVPSVKREIHRVLARYEKARPISTVHASDVWGAQEKFCGRAFALLDATKVEPTGQFISAASQITFGFGKAIEDLTRNWLVEAGILVGDWVCKICKAEQSFVLYPGKCSCGKSMWSYREMRFVSKVSGISCGIDLMVSWGSQMKAEIVEVKSIMKDAFKDLVAPLGAHRSRTNGYLRLIAESDHPASTMINTEKAKILYVCKGGYVSDPIVATYGFRDHKFSALKEFTITRDDGATEEGSANAASLLSFRKNGGGFPERICPNSLFQRAKSCQVVTECWGDKFLPGTKM